MFRHVWIVQDQETGCFLYPHQGDVSYTPLVTKAGHFFSEEEAVETAQYHCSEGFHLFSFYCLEQ